MPRQNARADRSVVERLRGEIADLIRGLAPGQQIPTEAQLKARFGASRPALREALRLLQQDGVLHAAHGQGRFVAPAAAVRVERPATAFESITEMLRRSGYSAVTRVLSVAEMAADAETAAALDCAEGSRLIRLERLRTHQGEPLIFSVNWIEPARLSGPLYETDWTTSLIKRLAAQGAAPVLSHARASAETLPDQIAGRYQLAGFGPSMLITETAFDAAGRPVLYAKDYHRGGRFSFSFVRRSEPGADRSTAVSRLATDLRRMIGAENLKVGEQLPTEEQLTTRFGVSRSTLREALMGLEQEGLIRAERGRGRFVAPMAGLSLERPITTFESANQTLAKAGYATTPELLGVRTIPASQEVAAALGLSPEARVLEIERVRHDGGAAILHSIDYAADGALTADAVRADRGGSLVELLAAAGQAPVMSTARATAISLPDRLAGRSEFAGFGPALRIEETCFTAAGAPVLHSIGLHKGSAFPFDFIRR